MLGWLVIFSFILVVILFLNDWAVDDTWSGNEKKKKKKKWWEETPLLY